MNAHKNARLTPYRREELVTRAGRGEKGERERPYDREAEGQEGMTIRDSRVVSVIDCDQAGTDRDSLVVLPFLD